MTLAETIYQHSLSLPEAAAREPRKNATDCERLMWLHLRAHRLQGFKFKRQQPIGAYIADFVCFEARCIVEADDGQHNEQIEYGARRDDWLRSQGFTVLRFWNIDILSNTEGVLLRLAGSIWIHPLPQPLSLLQGVRLIYNSLYLEYKKVA